MAHCHFPTYSMTKLKCPSHVHLNSPHCLSFNLWGHSHESGPYLELTFDFVVPFYSEHYRKKLKRGMERNNLTDGKMVVET